MSGSLSLLALLLSPVARAELPAAEAEVVDPVEGPEPASAFEAELQRLRDSVEAASDLATGAASERAALAALLEAGAALGDPRTDASARLELSQTLAESDHPATVRLLLSAARSREPSVEAAGIAGLGASVSQEAPVLLEQLLLERWGPGSETARLAVVEALGQHGSAAAGDVLYRAVASGLLPGDVQRAALSTLQARFPALLAERGLPRGRTERGVTPLVAVSSAGAGGVVLSSVGVWGRAEVAVAVGAVGGAGIGAGLGGLWASSESLSAGQGLRYSSDVLWGITGGVLAQQAILGDASSASRPDLGRNFSALLRAAGAGAGAASGAWQARHRMPDRRDVLEQDLAGFLGFHTGRGVGRLSGRWVTEGGPGERYSYYEYSEGASQAGTLLGAGLGLGGAALFRESWEASWTDVGLGAVGSAQLMVLFGSGHRVTGQRLRPGATRVGFGLGGMGGLALAEALEPTPAQVGMAAWGGGLGHALGAGIPLLVGADSDRVVAGTMLPVGLLGTVGGGLAAAGLPLERGDVALTAFAVPLALLEGGAIGAWAQDRELGLTGSQVGGLVLTTGAVTGVVTTALGPHIQPSPADVGMVASTTAWGAYHGLLVPLALDVDGRPSDLVLASTLTADAFLIAGSVLASPMVDLDPRRTLVPQVAGLGGATLGSLGALMVRDDGTTAARGALIGSTLGLGVGGLVEARRPPPDARRARAVGRLGLPELPGHWSVLAAPMPDGDGGSGVFAEVRSVGW